MFPLTVRQQRLKTNLYDALQTFRFSKRGDPKSDERLNKLILEIDMEVEREVSQPKAKVSKA